MQTHRDSVAPCVEDSLALRQQIDQLQEHIDLLMMESSVIQERRRLLQQQQVITLPAVTEDMQQLDNPYDSDESVHADILDIEENYEDSVSGLSFALEGARDFSMSRSLSGSTVTKPQSRGTTSKLRARLRDIMAEHRRLQSMTTPHEPPALFQGLVECL